MIKWLFKDRMFGSVYGIGLAVILGFILGATNAGWGVWIIVLITHIVATIFLEGKLG